MSFFLKTIRLWITILFIILTGTVLMEQHFSQAQEVIHQNEIEHCTNAIREASGVSQLMENELLNKAAAEKLEDMERFRYWAHRNPFTGKKPWDFFKNVGYDYKTAGENLAFGFHVGKNVCEAWVNSPTHYQNLINPSFQEIGVATRQVELNNTTGILIVQLLGSRTDFSLPDLVRPDTFSTASILSSPKTQKSLIGLSGILLILTTGVIILFIKQE